MFWLEDISRRELLSKAAQLIATASGVYLVEQEGVAAAPLSQSNQGKSGRKGAGYEIAPWTGDDFTLGHRLRGKQFPKFPDAPDSQVDFVIVGGGIAGLAAAQRLQHDNYLLLEQYDELGGQARGASFQGLDYSYGSGVIADTRGQLGELLACANLKPTRLARTDVSWLWDSHWMRGVAGQQNNKLYADFDRFIKEAQPVWRICPVDFIANSLTDTRLMALDRRAFSSHLTSYSSEFVALINSYLKTYLGAGAESVSALAGLAVLKSLVEPGYALAGGNSTLTKALSRQILQQNKDRIVTHAFVWSVEVGEQYSLVTYSQGNGDCRKVRCKHVIVTTPNLVSARLFKNMSDACRAQLLGYRYCSYLVATLFLKQRIMPPGYAHYVQSPLSFTELACVDTPYQLTGQHKTSGGSALTVYQPYEPGSNGRALLLAGDREAFASSIVAEVNKLTNQLKKQLTHVVLTRWGHALAIAGPGYFAKLNKLQSLAETSYSLAHSSNKGLPRLESAVAAGFEAANKALKVKQISGRIYSLPHCPVSLDLD